MLAAPTLFGRPKTIDSVGVSEKGNRINTRWLQDKKKRQKDIYHIGPRPIPLICRPPNPPLFLIGQYTFAYLHGLPFKIYLDNPGNIGTLGIKTNEGLKSRGAEVTRK
jgi:hypothetical protein